jgi:hypothetical protein
MSREPAIEPILVKREGQTWVRFSPSGEFRSLTWWDRLRLNVGLGLKMRLNEQVTFQRDFYTRTAGDYDRKHGVSNSRPNLRVVDRR